MKEVVCIYNANGGLLGEIAYVCKKALGQTHCDLCDISHGNNPLGKKEWKELADRFPIPVNTYHINEAPLKAREVANEKYPVVLVRTGDDYEVVMHASDLKECKKNPDLFFLKLANKLNVVF